MLEGCNSDSANYCDDVTTLGNRWSIDPEARLHIMNSGPHKIQTNVGSPMYMLIGSEHACHIFRICV